MSDRNLAEAAVALSRAIRNRWEGWHATGVEAGGIVVAYDKTHKPALAVGSTYNGYAVQLRPATPPVAAS